MWSNDGGGMMMEEMREGKKNKVGNHENIGEATNLVIHYLCRIIPFVLIRLHTIGRPEDAARRKKKGDREYTRTTRNPGPLFCSVFVIALSMAPYHTQPADGTTHHILPNPTRGDATGRSTATRILEPSGKLEPGKGQQKSRKGLKWVLLDG